MIVYLERAQVIEAQQHAEWRARKGLTTVNEMSTEEMTEAFGAQLAVADRLAGLPLWTIGYDPGGNVVSGTGALVRVHMKRDEKHHYNAPWKENDEVRWMLGVLVMWLGRNGSDFCYKICGQLTRATWLQHRELFSQCRWPMWRIDNSLLAPFAPVYVEGIEYAGME